MLCSTEGMLHILAVRQRGSRSCYTIALRLHHSEFELFEVGPSGALEGGFGVGVELVSPQTANGQEAAQCVRWKRRG